MSSTSYRPYLSEAARIYTEGGAKALSRRLVEFGIDLPGWVLLTRRGYATVSVRDMTSRVAVPNRSAARSIGFQLEHESVLIESILSEVRPGDLFIDVGANIGTIATLVSVAVPDGLVIACEPYPPNVTALNDTVAYSKGGDIIVVERPLADRETTVSLSVPDMPGTQELPSISRSVGPESIELRATTGDAIANAYSAPNLVKIDVEGAECDVLKGMEKSLSADKCRAVWVEVHIDTDEDEQRPLERVTKILTGHGFGVSTLQKRSQGLQLVGRR